MKKFLAVFLVLVLFGTAYGSTEDQEEVAVWNNVGGDQTITFLNLPTAGCTTVVGGAFLGNGADMEFDTIPIDDNQGNTYTIVQSTPAGRQLTIIGTANNITSSGTFSITFHPHPTHIDTFYGEVFAKTFCGLANPAEDKNNAVADPGPQAADANVSTAATTQANEIIVVVASICENSTGYVSLTDPTSGYTPMLLNADCLSNVGASAAWKEVKSIGVQSANWSHTDIVNSGTQDGWTAVIVTLKDAVPGGAVTIRRSPIIQ